jgi:hypothetical protein
VGNQLELRHCFAQEFGGIHTHRQQGDLASILLLFKRGKKAKYIHFLLSGGSYALYTPGPT